MLRVGLWLGWGGIGIGWWVVIGLGWVDGYDEDGHFDKLEDEGDDDDEDDDIDGDEDGDAKGDDDDGR